MPNQNIFVCLLKYLQTTVRYYLSYFTFPLYSFEGLSLDVLFCLHLCGNPNKNLSPGSEQQKLTQRAGDDVHFVHDAVAVADAAAARAVQPHRVHLVHEVQGAKLVRHVAHLLQRAHGTCRTEKIAFLLFSM